LGLKNISLLKLSKKESISSGHGGAVSIKLPPNMSTLFVLNNENDGLACF